MKDDLIRRQAAIDLANELYQGMNIIQTTYNGVRKAIVAFINLVPSAQPEQITCKDCNHCTFNAGAKIYCDELDMRMYQWDYCSRAERREE